MTQEIWKEIPEYEAHAVSSLGKCKSLTRINTYHSKLGTEFKRIIRGKYLKFHLMDEGYLAVGVQKDKVRKTLLVHRLVAEMFLPNPEKLPEVNHKDCNKQNNCVDNLEWCTSKENKEHAKSMGITNRGSRHGMSKLNEEDIPDIRVRLEKGETQTSISKLYKVSRRTIGMIKTGQTWGWR